MNKVKKMTNNIEPEETKQNTESEEITKARSRVTTNTPAFLGISLSTYGLARLLLHLEGFTPTFQFNDNKSASSNPAENVYFPTPHLLL